LAALTASTALALDASKNVVSVTNTGTGNNVLATAPTLVNDVTLSTGNLVIGTAGKGIDFSADSSAAGMTSELLDDYEEGTWTPVRNGFTENIGGGSITNTGAYTKIGRTVFVTARIACAGGATLAASSGAGSFLSGCPFSTSTNVPGSYVNSSTIADFGGILMAGTLMYVTNSWSADSHVWVFSATFNT